jgi:hypothetical protein
VLAPSGTTGKPAEHQAGRRQLDERLARLHLALIVFGQPEGEAVDAVVVLFIEWLHAELDSQKATK